MGKSDGSEHSGGRRHKSNSRMNYLKQVRQGGGGGGGGGGGRGGWRGGRGGGGDYVSAYGRDGQKKRQREYLGPGMRGFLLTTNFRETDCVRDGYNLLNEYYRPEDEIQGVPVNGGGDGDIKSEDQPIKNEAKMDVCVGETGAAASTPSPGPSDNKPDKKEEEDEDDDIDKALEKEMKELKSNTTFKFQSVDTGIKNVIFIKTAIPRPSEIAYRIFDDVVATKETRCRNILRLIPIDGTCRSDDQSIRQLAKELFTPHFAKGYKSFKVVINARHSNLHKDKILKTLAEVVSEVNALNFAKMTDPDYTIVAELLKSTVCLSVVRDFTKFKKFNITEIVSPTPLHPPKAKLDADKDQCHSQQEQEEGIEAAANPPNANTEEVKDAEGMEVGGCDKEDKSVVDEPVKSE